MSRRPTLPRTSSRISDINASSGSSVLGQQPRSRGSSGQPPRSRGSTGQPPRSRGSFGQPPSGSSGQPPSRLSQRSQPPGRNSTVVDVAPGGSRISVTSRTTTNAGGRGPGTAGRPSMGKPPTMPSRPSAKGKSLPAAKITITTSKGTIPPGKGKKPVAKKIGKESALKKFDRTVTEELKRRRDPKNVLVAATTSDVNLLEAADHLERAETAHAFAGALRAAEEAAATAETPELAEEAAVAGARDYETELIEVVDEDVPGIKPIQVIGYVGITRPTKATR